MDYDDKEFQGHNSHIDSEGSSKFSSVSHPYSLPNFDFEDGLQSHLRFDNLVENEAFLSLPNQEDNQWIEDFSRGSGGNNVWSEAASSESVEMLLKSVGQDESCQRLDIVAEQMESHFKEDDKTVDDMVPDLPLVSENVTDHNSVLTDVEVVSSSSGVEISTDGDNFDRRPEEDNIIEVHASLNKSSLSEMQDICGSNRDAEVKDSISQNNIAHTVFVDNQNSTTLASDVHSDMHTEVEDSILQDITVNTVSVDICASNMDTEVKDSILKDNIAHTVLVDNQNSTTLAPDVDSDMHTEVEDSILQDITVNTVSVDICASNMDTEVKDSISKDNIAHTILVDNQNSITLAPDVASDVHTEAEDSILQDITVNAVSVDDQNPPTTVPNVSSEMLTEMGNSVSEDVVVNTFCLGNQESTTMITTVGSDSASVKTVNEEVVVFAEELQVDDENRKEVTPIENLDNILCSSSKLEVVEIKKLEEPSSFSVIGCSNIHITEKCDEDVFYSAPEFIESSNMAPIHEQIDENIQDNLPKDFQGERNLVAHVIEVNANTAGEEVVNSSGEIEKEFMLQETGQQPVTEVSASENEATLLSKLDNTVSECQGNGTSTSFVVEHSIEVKDHSVELLKFGDNASVVHQGSSAEDFLSAPVSDQVVSNNDSLSPPTVSDQVASKIEEEMPIFPSDSSGMECKTIEPSNIETGVGISSNLESGQLNKEAVWGSERDDFASIRPDVTVETPPFVHGRGTTDDIAVDQRREKTKLKEAASVEAKLTQLKKTSRNADTVDPVLEIDKGLDFNLTEELSQNASDLSVPVVGILDTANESKQAKKAEKTYQISESSSLNIDLFSSICEPSSEQNRVADDSATTANHGATGKDHSLASSAVSDSDVLTPTISSCKVPDKSKNGKEIMVEKSSDKSFPPAVSVDSASKDAKQSDVDKDGKSFTFEVVNLSSSVVAESGQDKQFLPTTQSFTYSKGSPLTPSIGILENKTLTDPSLVLSQTLDPNVEHGSSTATPARKKGRPSGKTPKTVPDPSRVNSQLIDMEIANGGSTGTPSRKRGRPSGAKNKSSLKESTASIQSKKVDNQISSISTSITGTGKLQFEEVKLQEKAKHSVIVPVVTPTLPDLNTSASPSAIVVRQPFSDIQQMQLRAQIFVYGSLIQGAAPDETCMVAAFGTSDGGRTMWEPVWRAFVDKLQGVKSNSGKSENPLLPQLASNAGGSGPPKQSSTKSEALQSSVLLPPVGRASYKGTPSPVVNPMIPLSSPLWNASTPFHGMQSPGMMPRSSVFDYRPTPPASYPFQTPPSRNAAVNNSPWPSHTSFPAPWITSSQSSSLFDPSARLPTAETLKLNTPTKESVPHVNESVPPLASGANNPFPSASVSVEPYPPPVMNKITVSSGQKTAEPKTRKRKKSGAAPENLTPTPVLSQARIDSVPFPVPFLSHAQTDWVPSPIPFLSQARTDSVPSLIVPTNLSSSVIVSTPLFGSKGNDAKIVTTASPTYMSEQPKQVEPIIEKMAYILENNVLIQNEETAKQQAEEAAKSAVNALSHCETVWEQLKTQKSSGLKPEVEANLASAAVAVAAAADVAKAAAAAALVASNAASQAKIMFDESLISSKVNCPALNGDGSNSSSSILVAAKETARKRIEAASFASKLAENLDAVLKAAELASSAASQVGRIVAMGDPPSLAKLVEAGPQGYWKTTPQVNEERSNIGITQETLNVSGDEPRKKKAKSTSRDMFTPSGEVSKKSMGDHVKGIEGTLDFFTRGEKDSREKRDSKVSELDKTIGIVPVSESGLRPTFIEEGCLVEVKKEGNGFKEAWFSATVLSMANGKAFVSYTGSRSGSTEIKEWVPLEGDADNEPRIRIAHSDKQFDGNRKRRRGEFGDRVWFIGDKVDVWTRECWREGVVTDNKVDEPTLMVHFPAEGETSAVKPWNLRPTLIWKDGEWIENSSSRQNDPSYKGDTPKEKRLKLGEPSVEGSKKDLSLTYQRPGPARPEVLQLLPLSEKEKTFNIGNNKEDANLDARKTGRGGLQKEGARVVFGVPKPGRTKKFMDVSKHYVAESSNKTDNKSREKNSIPRDDGKVKQQGELKARIPKPGKAMSSFGRTIPQKDKFQSSAMPAKKEARRSTSTDESEPEEKRKLSDFTFSSSALSRDMFTSKTKLERPKGRQHAPVAGRWAKGEAKDHIGSEKQVSDNSEPRRSNRRIQPTSRLLEGLQTSLTLPKFPSFAHDKGQRSHSRSTPKGR